MHTARISFNVNLSSTVTSHFEPSILGTLPVRNEQCQRNSSTRVALKPLVHCLQDTPLTADLMSLIRSLRADTAYE